MTSARPQSGRIVRGPQLPYEMLAGVEPCPRGWLVAAAKLVGVQIHPEPPRVVTTFRELLDNTPAFRVIAVHIPIGLPTLPSPGGRACDRAARQVLGFPRHGAVVPAPAKAALEGLDDYEKAAALNGGRMDVVTWRLLPRIAEIAAEVQSYHQRTVFEVNPELAFFQLNDDRPMTQRKRSRMGVAEREALLRQRVPGIERVLDARLPRVRKRHLVDAAGDLWTARRIVARAFNRLPEDPEWNDDGLRMEIVR